ncbi:adenosylcobinamide kinase/adenosylcobinamide-phosphate guanylyltransferase [Enterococcus sp. PF1-24]|uniref:bifunctional adenosylcobinamide kinase/adenosylcobinamide-phosphate guanylyltransferase n=1 Tax=unclassified Enterococcus TaxID=2608891 RepID=UPI00247601E8|nr:MULTISPECIES: bifunctional adenosylcobinamide kinase/adenosylcobinamide-phosphate guanylyltransferase [unclassified Enterococcus]MDH6363367.1 adenosylcobinamide kinase/adenosylcobinamide-phosphate guanylyltransferase [Enterococcus sp. PFB1-1]MDH6400332.1 adenosylcobinamide kinase/adenosylcobinamide-phosphate guanylyltransferase [Enterococcus sp. PF1-24]
MGEITLVIGGARSGKSVFAEELLQSAEKVCYIATNALPQDAEMQQRIKLHQARRSSQWQTHEGFLNLAEFISEEQRHSNYLLDCGTMLTTNYFFHLMSERYGTDYQVIDQEIAKFSQAEKAAIEQEILVEWTKIITAIKTSASDVVIVTNEVGLGIVPEDAFTRWFRDIYGRVNQYLGKEATAVQLVVAGIAVKIK